MVIADDVVYDVSWSLYRRIADARFFMTRFSRRELKNVKRQFNLYDLDGNGSIDQAEVRKNAVLYRAQAETWFVPRSQRFST